MKAFRIIQTVTRVVGGEDDHDAVEHANGLAIALGYTVEETIIEDVEDRHAESRAKRARAAQARQEHPFQS